MQLKDKPQALEAPATPCQVKKKEVVKLTIDICGISAMAFQANLKREENIFFATSLFEIDYELTARTPDTQATEGDTKDLQQPNEMELQWLERILPKKLTDYTDVFSKKASNILS